MIKRTRKIVEFFIEKALLLSGSVTSIAIILIVIFLFREGIGLFSSPEIEHGYVLALNKENAVQKLNAHQVKDIFDHKITNWSEVGGKSEEIVLFRLDDITNYVSEEELGDDLEHVPQALSKIVSENPGIIAFIPAEYVLKDFNGRTLEERNISLESFFFGKEWYPTSQPAAQFGQTEPLAETLDTIPFQKRNSQVIYYAPLMFGH